MSLISQTIPDLIGGVSQQAPILRYPNQSAAQINCKNSPIEGLAKRLNTKHLGDLSDLPENYTGMMTHVITRDEYENYLVGIKQGKLEVWDLNSGYNFPVEMDTSVNLGYLYAGSTPARKAFRALTLGDDTYILNTTYPVAMNYSKLSGLRQSQVDKHYHTLVFTQPRFDKHVPTNPYDNDSSEYSGKRVIGGRYVFEVRINDGGSYNADIAIDGNANYNAYKALKAENTPYLYWNGRETYIKTRTDQDFFIVDNSYLDVEYTHVSKVFSDGEWKSTTRKWVEKVPFEGVSYRDSMAYEVPDKTPPKKAFVWVRQADYSVTYTITLNGKTYSHTTPEATADGAREGLASQRITQALVDQLKADPSVNEYIQVLGSTIIITSNPHGTELNISVSDDLYGDALRCAYKQVESQEDLPPSAHLDDVLFVSGDAETDNDGYYVRFQTNGSGVTPEGRWEETTKLYIPTHLDERTLPIKLSRYVDAKYETTENPYGIYFELNTVDWAPRTVGDEDSSPIPLFCSTQDEDGFVTEPRSIKAISFYRGRLWMMGADYYCASVAGDMANFWRSTALTVLDDDPVDGYLDLSGQAETIHSALTTDAGLMLFTERGQYVVTSQGSMTPATSEVNKVASYESDNLCTPVSIGDRISFTTQAAGYSSVHELYVDNTTATRRAVEVTSHIPTYIRGRIATIVGSSVGSSVFFVSRTQNEGLTSKLYVYDYLFSGSERVQSAWSIWNFEKALVIDAALTQDSLYLILDRSTDGKRRVTLEKIDITLDPIKEKHGHPVLLDSLRDCGQVEPMDLLEGEIKKQVKHSSGYTWYRGFPYLMRHTLSPLFLRPDGQSAGETGGRLQLRRLTLNFHNTTSFYVEVATKGRETRVVHFQGRVLGDITNIIGRVPVISGERSFPLLGASESIEVSIFNDSIYDAQFQSAFWEGFYHNRARRF